MTEKKAKERVGFIEAQIFDIKQRHEDELAPLEQELKDARQLLGFVKLGFKAGDVVEYEGKRYLFAGYDKNVWATGYVIRKSDGLPSDQLKILHNEYKIKKVELDN